jgi:hypothetical protein
MSRQSAMTKRILRCWRHASAAELAEGLEWYGVAGASADSLAAGALISRAQAAGVIAALSPRCQWTQNIAAAAKLVDAWTAGRPRPMVAGFNGNAAKAWAILECGPDVDPLDVLGGPKVRAFYANIMGDLDAVTVDVWAARAAEGKHFTDRAPAGKRYERIAASYRAAAAIVGVSPRDMQAAVWIHVRASAR